MALTPLDIQNKVFSNKMRGFDRDEVLDFLDLVARDYEIAVQKNRELEKSLKHAEEKLAYFNELKDALNQSIIVAQDTADKVKSSATKESEVLVTSAQNVVSMQQSRANKFSTKPRSTRENQAANKIIIIEPRAYSEAMKIAKHIMNGESVLVNFHQIEEYQARRIVDFLTGTVYAENGDIKRVGNEIFLCTAQGVEIDGTAQSLMDANMLEIQ